VSRARSIARASLLLAPLCGLVLLLPAAGQGTDRREVIRSTMPAVVMVMAVDVVDGRLEPVGSGSGTIVDPDGSVLTNYHVLSDSKGGRLYDLFVIGRFRAADRDPEMVCAGSPSRGKLKPQLDLALIKCDVDMNGQPWKPSTWPSLPIGRSEDIVPGEQVWVLGYPNVGGSTIHVTAGLVSGWTGEHGGAGSRAFMKTDAAITHGNSGGTAVDDVGRFIGVPTAFRVTTAQQGEQVATVGKVGLIRPVEHARDLLAAARRGWTPTEGENSVDELDLRTREAQVSPGVTVTGRVVDAANREAIAGAFVIIFKPGLRVSQLDRDKLDEQALAWGQTNAGGSFTLGQPVPRGRSYAVAVLADGYHPLASDDALTPSSETPDLFQPWPEIRLERRR
jgi:S1-C subfamily serine protease